MSPSRPLLLLALSLCALFAGSACNFMGNLEKPYEASPDDAPDLPDEDTPEIEDETDASGDLPEDAAELPEDPCETFGPSTPILTILPGESTTLEATGAQPPYHWTLRENQSGASLDASSGVYVAGEIINAVDEVTIASEACETPASMTIRVPEPMRVEKDTYLANQGWNFCLEVLGGSRFFEDSPYTWRFAEQGSTGATLDASGCYTAGSPEEAPEVQDVLQVTDNATGQSLTITVTVQNAPIALSLERGARSLAMGRGQSHTLNLEGGSGNYETRLVGDTGGAQILQQDGQMTLRAENPAHFLLIVKDQTIQALEETRIPVSVLPIREANHASTNIYSPRIGLTGKHSLNADNIPDILLGLPNHSANAVWGGAVLLYQGRADNPPELTQFIPGHTGQRLGYSLATGDFNNDGCHDVAIGAPGGYNGPGEVQIWTGCQRENIDPYTRDTQGRLQDNHPELPNNGPLRLWKTLHSPEDGNFFGEDLVAADFNNDGRTDLAIGAPLTSAEPPEDPHKNTGAVYLYLQPENPDTWPNNASITVPGVDIVDEIPSSTPGEAPELVPGSSPDLLFGTSIAAHDINQDGCADLLVGAPGARTNAGIAVLYLSRASSPGVCTALNPETPRHFFASTHLSGKFGNQVAFSDTDGDCTPDPVISEGPSNTYHGALYAYHSAENWNAPTPIEHTTPGLKLHSMIPDSAYAYDFSFGDLNNNGSNDLLLSLPGLNDGQGSLWTYHALPSVQCNGGTSYEILTFPSTQTSKLPRTQNRFGHAVQIVGDTNQDGFNDVLVLEERGSSENGPHQNHLGKIWWYPALSPDNARDIVPTELPTLHVSQGEGRGSLVVPVGDLNGDGFEDFAQGRFQADLPPERAEGASDSNAKDLAGDVNILLGGPEGVSTGAVITGYTNQTAGDSFGYTVTGAGDFNQDGHSDLIVSAVNAATHTRCRVCDTPNNKIRGALFVYQGGPNGALAPLLLTPSANLQLRNPDHVICGPSDARRLGRRLLGNLDTNGDNQPDLLVGAYRGTDQVLYLLESPISTDLPVTCLTDENRLEQDNPTPAGLVREGLITMDLDGAPCADIVQTRMVATDRHAEGSTLDVWIGGRGEHGCPEGPLRATLRDADYPTGWGWRIAPVHFNNDGLQDLAITVLDPNGGPSKIVVYSGASLSVALGGLNNAENLVINLLNSDRLATLEPPEGENFFGAELSNLGDLDEDGIEELLIGSTNGDKAGKAWVYSGATPRVHIPGISTITGGLFGATLAGSAFQTQEQKRINLVIGAPLSETPGPEQGAQGATLQGQIHLP